MLPITIPRDDPAFLARFWAKVDKSSGPNGCWLWTGAKIKDGYGNISISGTMFLSHRVSWAISFGSISSSLCVLHRCDNPPCVNPSHLWVGTHRENMLDMILKGRSGPERHPERIARGDLHGSRLHPESRPRGEHHGRAILTEKAVVAIRNARGTQAEIASQYGVSRAAVGLIRSRKVWKHLQ